MITYAKKGRRHSISMNDKEFDAFAEVIFLLNHTPPPVGFNRKPLTSQQKNIVEGIYNTFSYHPEYKTYLNKKTDQ